MTRPPIHCRTCGELMAEHIRPCDPARCVSARCEDPMVDSTLGLCRRHLDVVDAQRGRPTPERQLRVGAMSRS